METSVNNKCRAFTSLEQSKKLAEILPPESADIYWWSWGERYYIGAMDDGDFNEKVGDVRAWSLAALLYIIPKRIKDYNVLRIDINEKDTAIWYDEIGYGVNNDLPDITKETAIDACYEMITRLNELNLL